MQQTTSGEQLVGDSTQLLNNYDLLKDDFESILQLTGYSGVNPYAKVIVKIIIFL